MNPIDLGFDLRDVITAVLVLLAALMCFAAGVGLIRFPDVLSRLHAATKPQILGIMAIVADVAVTNPSVGTITLAVAIIVFQSLTAPVSAHMVGRAAYRTNHFRRDILVLDELTAQSFEQAHAPREIPPIDQVKG
ncbi:monovalent cation/H(+) antiporter subunit G [Herbiconiux ginsengi]|uniref:Multisubunit sodium/proton antiporter, MrpG subunit n=1 Tax=Herbiconiux ginsengi TaxID=381665 RepID=A0A1H3MP44_9MICO|nr:monovalent cation/H(+) antiporter subunit G [Herbiconiux ginsengi]SDY78366.1 multisubunit sodium/proton antiporter, MrpG subunit [Herbiconiux ginsengi]